jgi:hypothetical protein
LLFHKKCDYFAFLLFIGKAGGRRQKAGGESQKSGGESHKAGGESQESGGESQKAGGESPQSTFWMKKENKKRE